MPTQPNKESITSLGLSLGIIGVINLTAGPILFGVAAGKESRAEELGPTLSP